jgi:hypothetical protein
MNRSSVNLWEIVPVVPAVIVPDTPFPRNVKVEVSLKVEEVTVEAMLTEAGRSPLR